MTGVSTGITGLAAIGLWGWSWRAALLVWPLAVFARHGHPGMPGWIIEVPWLILVTLAWLGARSGK